MRRAVYLRQLSFLSTDISDTRCFQNVIFFGFDFVHGFVRLFSNVYLFIY